jgi:hypothetical protein
VPRSSPESSRHERTVNSAPVMPTPIEEAKRLTPWQTLGMVDPRRLADSRDTLHHAAQLLALAAASFIRPEADDSHTSMSWLESRAALATQPIPASTPSRFALSVADLTLLVIDEQTEQARDALALDGARRADALAWMAARLTDVGLDASRLRTTLHFAIPPHPTDAGAAFQLPSDDSLGELARWYADASLVFEERRASMVGAGPVRCWPHHFDMATLVRLPFGGPFTTIGIGLSPGDDSYPEPYYYVGPQPAPTMLPPALSVGRWHTTGWWGAALVGTEIVTRARGEQQAGVVRQFIHDAVTRLLALPTEAR